MVASRRLISAFDLMLKTARLKLVPYYESKSAKFVLKPLLRTFRFNGNADEVLRLLNRLVDRKLDLGAERDDGFAYIRKTPAWAVSPLNQDWQNSANR